MMIRDLGKLEFEAALAIQEQLAAGVAAGTSPETLLLLEHPPVYTIGRGGCRENVLDPGIRVVEANRGGDVTFHGPGQLVGYPVIDLGRRGRDLHRYLRILEELLINVAAEFGVAARREPGRTGIWTDGGKLASIGVGVRRWVTMHGFALNVTNELAPFRSINPCGIVACPITSLSAILGRPVPLGDVRRSVAGRFPFLLDERLPFLETAEPAP
ncbi:lipoate-protein ligase B [Geobacter metallireducens RCH3]|uniref:Octanoyltransferase n=1 Tax=Geobacter metallireducens (strain ATCC 53774 / DSM 7210 / GS-15) TaxID=269799 RepID=LIPB_GEOMG|nr:lipoyl(octanoyl) transferase LipB [Geobacter metallireducens]Q39S09.1 RecName: Full=Octanoyltransferase; AltName: Full=Lipoate-protein ligase B; AltName: Full=Lipoyl/octanoyl transferase; AltName: Full=Octanoyl-[acyl-carrier-protein]-protein N-octanoyltransferase [Geobacter metallireducens GS-15]ABB32965.1 octanoyl-(acyl carrier protein)--protein octanoyltransferase [Geobacter metallireducens GS-15]EHP88899.1 lipoate-protein ligase B [Geobacter metallireducens RCH3]